MTVKSLSQNFKKGKTVSDETKPTTTTLCPVETLRLDGKQTAPDISEAGDFLASIAESVEFFFIEHGFESIKARDSANQLVLVLSKRFAGEWLYFNKKAETYSRWISIVLDLKHMHYKDVDRKYGLSPGDSLLVKKKLEEKRFEKAQLKLPIV